jgi:hypothetical protein
MAGGGRGDQALSRLPARMARSVKAVAAAQEASEHRRGSGCGNGWEVKPCQVVRTCQFASCHLSERHE